MTCLKRNWLASFFVTGAVWFVAYVVDTNRTDSSVPFVEHAGFAVVWATVIFLILFIFFLLIPTTRALWYWSLTRIREIGDAARGKQPPVAKIEQPVPKPPREQPGGWSGPG
jgi:hypothetical protein